LNINKPLGAANKEALAAFTSNQTTWTFAGAFLTLSALMTLNASLGRNFDANHTVLVLG
jgi:hypothetical protein